jgi:dipeptidyl aminopeptidase/acylaminoacyl peptidase
MHAWKQAVLVAVMVCAWAGAQAAEKIPAEAFARFSKLSSPALSPDGKYLAASLDLDHGASALAVFRLSDMGQTALLKFPRYELATQVAWVSNTRLVIAKGRKVGSLEQPRPNGEIIASNFDGTGQKYIYGYEQRATKSTLDRGFGYIEGVPELRNSHFYLRQLSLDARSSRLYDVDSEKVSFHLIADIGRPNLDFVIDHAGVPRFAVGADLDDKPLLYRSSGGEAWQPMPTSEQDLWMPFAFSPDDTQVYATRTRRQGPAELVRSDPQGGNLSVLARDDFSSVTNLQWTHAPMTPFAAQAGRGPTKFTYFDTTSPDAQLHQALTSALPGKRVDFINQSQDGQVVLLFIDSDRDPGAWYLFKRAGNKLERLLTPREGIEPKRMGERRVLRFTASDGLPLEAILTLPAGVTDPKALPMVLLPHGGPHEVRDDWEFDTDAQFLASRGYLVLQVNYRGSSGRGFAFEEAGYLKWGTRIQDDLIDGVRWTIDQGMSDPKRICVYGGSFGGYSAMMTAARAPDMFQCAVGLAGVYDLDMMYSKGDIKTTESGRRYLQRVIGRDKAALDANSPASLASKIKVPVLLAHGEDDQRAPFAQAKAMRAALTASGNTPQWLAVPDEGHGFYNEDNNIAWFKTLETFLDMHIGTATP